MGSQPDEGHRITEAILIKAISNEFHVKPEDVKVKSFDISGGSAKGDNYACTMKAVEVSAVVKGEEKRLNYIAKCVPMSEFRVKFIKESGIFNTEVVVYESLLPRLKNLEKCCSTNPNFPKHFYASDEDGVIIMENMKLKGWYMADKAGLTATELRLLLQQLARLHATSYHFLNTFPGGLEAFKKQFEVFIKETWLPKNSDGSSSAMEQLVEQMFSGFYNSYVDIVSEVWNGDRGLVDALKNFNTVRNDRLNELHKPNEDGKAFNCMLHMDSWCNNFFFRNNPDGVVSEAAILDLQIMKRGRPCIDVAYLIGTSTTPDFRKKHLGEMLGFYHKELSRVLLLHGYDSETLFSFDTFMKEFNECYVIAFVMGAMCIQLHLTQPDPEDFFKGPTEEQQAREHTRKIELVKSDDSLRSRFIDTATEAIAYGILSGV